MEAISARGLIKVYGARAVLDGADLVVDAGSRTAVYGRTGLGKTTLLYIIAGLVRPEGGTVELFGGMANANGSFMPPEERSIGMVFQRSLLWPHMKVASNVEFALWQLRLPASERRRRALEVLDIFGVVDLASRRPDTLSGGQVQRVALARSIAAGPRILLWDEPFTGLDDQTREDVAARALSWISQTGTTLVMVSHRSRDAEALSAKVMVLEDGRLVEKP